MGQFAFVNVLVFVVVAGVCGVASSGPTAMPPHENLMKLCLMLRNQNAGMLPSTKQVVDGYLEYVQLHKIQSNSVTAFQDTAGRKQKVNEDNYKLVADILGTEEVRVISENLFSVFDELELDSKIDMDKMRLPILKAIEQTYRQ